MSTISPYNDHNEVLDRKDAFIEAFRTKGIVAVGLRAAGIPRAVYYEWIETDPDFKKQVQYALEDANDYVREKVFERGVEGYEEPLTYQGQTTGDYVPKFHPDLLLREAEYRDKGYRRGVSVDVSEIPVKIVHGVLVQDVTGLDEAGKPVLDATLDPEEAENSKRDLKFITDGKAG